MAKYETHDFYCLKCAHPSMPIMRKVGKQHGMFHRKKLWCCNCKTEINHMEIRNQQEKEIFMEAYNNGEYREEAEESVAMCRNTWQR